MGKRIKDTYQKHLFFYIFANVIIFWVISLQGFINFELIGMKFTELINHKSIFLILSPIISVVFNGFLSNSIKEILVFWRFKNRLPGCRAFTKLINTDQRIDITSLKKLLGKFPEDPSEQNRLWYKIYRDLSNNDIIIGSHRDFLLTRDLCSISFVFILFLIPIALVIWENMNTKIYYTIFLISQYLLTSVAARNYGKRFVCNVLSLKSEEKYT